MSIYFPTAEQIAANEGTNPTPPQRAAFDRYQQAREEHTQTFSDAARTKVIDAVHDLSESGWIPKGMDVRSTLDMWKRTTEATA